MRRIARNLRSNLRDRSELGMTTAEYAVGTVAACSLGAILYKVINSGLLLRLIEDVITRAFHSIF